MTCRPASRTPCSATVPGECGQAGRFGLGSVAVQAWGGWRKGCMWGEVGGAVLEDTDGERGETDEHDVGKDGWSDRHRTVPTHRAEPCITEPTTSMARRAAGSATPLLWPLLEPPRTCDFDVEGAVAWRDRGIQPRPRGRGTSHRRHVVHRWLRHGRWRPMWGLLHRQRTGGTQRDAAFPVPHCHCQWARARSGTQRQQARWCHLRNFPLPTL